MMQSEYNLFPRFASEFFICWKCLCASISLCKNVFFADLCKMRDRLVSQQQMQLSMRQPQTSLPQNQLKAQPQWLQQQQKLLRHIGANSGGIGTVESTSPGSGLATQGRLLAQTQTQSAQSSSPLLLSKLPPSPFGALFAG